MTAGYRAVAVAYLGQAAAKRTAMDTCGERSAELCSPRHPVV